MPALRVWPGHLPLTRHYDGRNLPLLTLYDWKYASKGALKEAKYDCHLRTGREENWLVNTFASEVGTE
jgi:hypothetical protein